MQLDIVELFDSDYREIDCLPYSSFQKTGMINSEYSFVDWTYMVANLEVNNLHSFELQRMAVEV